MKIGCYEVETRADDFRKGAIKNVYHRSVEGHGYQGEGAYSHKTHKLLYQTWRNMLMRVFSEDYHKKKPTYIGVEVCDEWLNLQVFGKWFEENFIEDYVLDKDLLGNSTKIYSPDTCLFISPRLNSFLTNKKSVNKSGYTGVYWHNRDKVWVASIHVDGKPRHLGYFDKIEEANETYKVARLEQANLLKELYKDKLPKEALDAIH